MLRAFEYPELRMSTNEVPGFVFKIYFYLCVYLYVGLCTFLQSPGVQGGEFPGTSYRDVVSPNMDAGNCTWILNKSNMCYSLLSHLSRPTVLAFYALSIRTL